MKLLKWYGWLGLVSLMVATVSVALGNAWFARFYTPVMWSGYILLVDAIVFRLQGRSRITDSPREFFLLLWISALGWLIFEIYNLRLQNWYYVNVPSNATERTLGYLWAFATIFPGMFETSDLLQALGSFKRQNNAPQHRWGSFWLSLSMAVGIAFVIIPPLLPQKAARFTFGFVWLGYFYLLEPINYRIGAPSLLRDWEQGKRRTLYTLAAGGAVCGLLWEGWNFYTLQFGGGAWIYALPYPLNVLESTLRIGRMPLLGFLGFPPFALECWAMWHFLKTLLLPSEMESARKRMAQHPASAGD